MKHDGKDYEETIHENTEKHTDFIIKKTSEGDIELLAGINYNSVKLCFGFFKKKWNSMMTVMLPLYAGHSIILLVNAVLITVG